MIKEQSLTIICSSCMRENPEGSVYCSNCNMPIGINSTNDPVQMAISEGRSMGDGVMKPHKGIIVIGMWVIFMPSSIFFLFPSYTFLSSCFSGSGFSGFILGLFFLSCSIFFGFLVLKTTRSFYRLKKDLKSDNLSDNFLSNVNSEEN